MAENDLKAPVLGVAWDGTGYGIDGTVWGGEFLLIDKVGFTRVASFRPFCLPGGEKAVREPWRTALGLLYEVWGDKIFLMQGLAPISSVPPHSLDGFQTMLRKKMNSPVTSSAGRLFDAVASILGIQQVNRFEGQAAMQTRIHPGGSTQRGLL